MSRNQGRGGRTALMTSEAPIELLDKKKQKGVDPS